MLAESIENINVPESFLEQVARLLEHAERTRASKLVSAINLGEIYSISYADCFALASALDQRASIVTGDPEFKKVEHLVNVVWIG